MLIRSDGKRFKARSEASANAYRTTKKNKPHTPAPRPIVKKDAFYEVEKVVGQKNSNLGLLYLVKWAGYDAVHNSWIDTLPPFFDKRHAMYQKTSIEYDSDGSDSIVESVEGSVNESVEGSEDEWVKDSGDESCDESSDGWVCGAVQPTKNRKQKHHPTHEDTKSDEELYIKPSKYQKKSKKDKMVVKALLALSAVVAAGGVDDSDCESDE